MTTAHQTEGIALGNKISVFGSFSPTGNTLFIEQRLPGNFAHLRTAAKNSAWKESATRIDLQVPTDLLPDRDAVFYVIDAEGRASNARPVYLGQTCEECGPELRACQSVLSGETQTFRPGTFTSIYGYFPNVNNRVVIEQWDENGQTTRLDLDSEARGFEETETMIRVGLPAEIHPGRAIIYIVDPEGRETAARDILISPSSLAVVSAASYRPTQLAPGGIAAAFGTALAATDKIASTIPLPTSLAGTSVVVRDFEGADHVAPLFFVSPQQVNFLVPGDTPLGPATIIVTSEDGSISSLPVSIVTVAPGLFTANADGAGAASANAIHVKADDSQIYEWTAALDSGTGRYVPAPITFGPPSESLYFAIYGTGWRRHPNTTGVTVRIGSTPCPVSYIGPQGTFSGLDQLNVLVPRTLAGRGEVEMTVTIDGITANTSKVNFR